MAGPIWGAKQFTVLGAALVLGLLTSFQWFAEAERRPLSPDRVSQTVLQLELEQSELKRQLLRLRKELDGRQQEAVDRTELLEGLREELDIQKARAGLVEVRGPGVRVTLDDSHRGAVGRVDDYLVHDFDLRDLIGVLWLSGAEAVVVNGERIVHGTSIYCVGSTIMVNDTRLSPAYHISAIGDPYRMQEHLINPGYLGDLKARRKRVDLVFGFERAESITIPAYQGSVLLQYAQSGGAGR